MGRKSTTITIIFMLLSITTGLMSHDLLIGGLALFTALMCSYFSSEGKRISYIYGLINYLLIGLISFKNHLYGLFFFGMIVCPIIQIQGYISWGKNLDENKNVKVREFTLRNSIIITISCILGSLIISYLLTLIPDQRIAFMDASSNTINLCAVILGILRFKECWWIWLINNTIDLSIWLITFISKGEGSFMMLLVSISYLVINFYGIIKWNKEAKKNMNS
ncbi:MAG: nicotinamide riboside transporter PnuC [Bacilli bacterium]|nr:nicotinamide riboside transporter PnuC [Bacilli bacterium]